MRRIRSAALVAATAMAVGALWGPTSGIAQESGSRDTVTVEARREVDVQPDIARVLLGVRARGLTAESATDRLANRTRRVLDALEAEGFTDDELSTQNINLDRRCLRDCHDPKPKDDIKVEPVIGYVGSASVQIETARMEAIGNAIDVGVAAGATSIRNVSFDVEDKSEAVKQALREAMLLATEKAQILAETGGRSLGRALMIIEGNARQPRTFSVEGDTLEAVYSRAKRGSGAGNNSNPFPIEPPTLSASARVEVTFELI